MVIRAKFAGRCPACGEFIEVGDLIVWEKGKKATHAKCPRTVTLSHHHGRSCSCDDDCCANGCHCDAHCVCRGGNIYDC